MDFITIDFETATAQRDSPCELGLTFVRDGCIQETKSWLIRPMYEDFDYFNILIHGIRPEHVLDEPEFDVLWEDVRPLIENKFLIAHNAGFDMSVLRWTLEAYGLPFPSLNYACSYIFSKKVWQGLPAYDLKTLCSLNKIELQHHRAGPDSRATAELALMAFEAAGVTTFEEFTPKLKTTIGQLYEGGYKPSETKREYRNTYNAPIITGDPTKHNPESIFYGKKVVFTGALLSMVRSEAQQVIADIGGVLGRGVTQDTDFLVVGQQDYRVVGEDGMSSKQKRAIQLIEKGFPIEILSEADFLRMV